MKNKLRKIIVDGLNFSWRYQDYIGHLPALTSRFLAFNKAENLHIEVFFLTQDTWIGGNPLSLGLPVLKQGYEEAETLNFNKPKYVSELLRVILKDYLREQLSNLVIKNGNDLISRMGYKEKSETMSYLIKNETTN